MTTQLKANFASRKGVHQHWSWTYNLPIPLTWTYPMLEFENRITLD